MLILRILPSRAILRAGAAIAGLVLPELHVRPIPSAQASPSGFILLVSIVGMAICATWIGVTWRAWG